MFLVFWNLQQLFNTIKKDVLSFLPTFALVWRKWISQHFSWVVDNKWLARVAVFHDVLRAAVQLGWVLMDLASRRWSKVFSFSEGIAHEKNSIQTKNPLVLAVRVNVSKGQHIFIHVLSHAHMLCADSGVKTGNGSKILLMFMFWDLFIHKTNVVKWQGKTAVRDIFRPFTGDMECQEVKARSIRARHGISFQEVTLLKTRKAKGQPDLGADSGTIRGDRMLSTGVLFWSLRDESDQNCRTAQFTRQMCTTWNGKCWTVHQSATCFYVGFVTQCLAICSMLAYTLMPLETNKGLLKSQTWLHFNARLQGKLPNLSLTITAQEQTKRARPSNFLDEAWQSRYPEPVGPASFKHG